MIIESDFDNRQFADNLVELREKAGLSIDKLAERVGVAPDLVDSWENAQEIPTEAQKNDLEKVLDWPLVLPPRKLAAVKFGDWEKLFDERLAPLAREMLIAGFSTMSNSVDNLGIHLHWLQPHRALDFLNIVTRFEKGSHTMYSRVNPQADSTGRIPKWDFNLRILDLAENERSDGNFLPNFFGGLDMDIPPHDVATVITRLKEHNELQERTALTRKYNTTPNHRIYVPVHPYYRSSPYACYNLWATSISEDASIVDNIPVFTDAVAYRDIVRVSPQGDFLELLERLNRTVRANYDAGKSTEENKRLYRSISEHFEKNGVVCEGVFEGMFTMSVPSTIMDDRFQELWNTCPVKVYRPGEKPMDP